MGFFSKLFAQKTNDPMVLQVIERYKSRGLNEEKAQKKAIETVNSCRQECERLGTSKYSNIGKKVFELVKDDPDLARFVEKARIDGATDEDIVYWWSASDIERAIVQRLDEEYKMAALITYLDQGLTQEKAIEKVKKYHPIYGYADNDSDSKRPIPPELKARIDNFIADMGSSILMRDYFKRMIDKSDNFNELVRKLISEKKL